MFQQGDKVSFISEKQDGIVTAIKPDGTVVVEIEDGFTLDATPKELVLIKATPKGNKPTFSTNTQSPEIVEPVYNFITQFNLAENIAIVVIPAEEKVMSGDLNYWLVNGSNFRALFNFNSKKGRTIEGFNSGQVDPGESFKLGTFNRTKLIDIDHFLVQVLLYKKGVHGDLPFINKDFQVIIPTLHQTFPKAPSPLSYAIVHPIINFSFEPEPDIKELMKKYKEDISAQPVQERSIKNEIREKKIDLAFEQFGLNPAQSEIDLHIEELVEDPSGMIASEMITLQLNYFRKELDRALLSRAHRIVFIHGVGNGRLKNAIRTELNGLQLRYKDGNYDRYGGGATEVILS
ncbi:DUF2027 domain-containing protein [soil metagenome]